MSFGVPLTDVYRRVPTVERGEARLVSTAAPDTSWAARVGLES